MIYNNASYNNPENTTIKVDINGATSFVPCAFDNADYVRIDELVKSGNLVISEYDPPPTKVLQITMRQCRIELLKRGLLQQVQALVDSQKGVLEIEWEYSTVVDRNSAFVSSIASQLSPPLTSEDVDALFLAASSN